MGVMDYLAPLLLAAGVALSNAAGIGGGSISVAILLTACQFSTSEAVPIANFLMLLGCVARLMISCREKHPRYPHRPAIHYDFIIILLPMALVGTLLGVMINETVPEVITKAIVMILFLYVFFKSLFKGLKLSR